MYYHKFTSGTALTANRTITLPNANVIVNSKYQLDFGGSQQSTTSTSYASLLSFIFPGTNNLDWTVASIKAIIDFSAASPNGNIRIYDATNSLVICELANTTSAGVINISSGGISNLPTGEAQFGAQLLCTTSGTAYVNDIQF